MKRLFLAIVLAITLLTFPAQRAHAFWGIVSGSTVEASAQITIGEWQFITVPDFDPDGNYDVGDEFYYDGSIWIIIGSWFNPNQFTNPDGTVNFNYVRTWGPVNENTPYWRDYNTYQIGEIVIWEGYEWIVRHAGANSVEPGTGGNSWNRISDEWFIYNTYQVDDIVIFEGQEWIATAQNWNKQPGLYPWAWQLIED